MAVKLKQIIYGCLTMLAICFSLEASAQSEKTFTIGISVWTGYPNNVRGFKDALAAGGLVEGKNVTFLYGKSGLDNDRQQQIAEDFKSAGVDLVYTLTTPGTTIIKDVIGPDTPIVFSIVTYPADSGLIESFEYSGNNLVGTSNYVPLPNYVSLLKEILPTAQTVAIFHRKGEPNSKIQAANMIRLLKRAGMEAIDLEASDVEEVRKMALGLVGAVDVFMTTTDTLMQGGGEEALIEISLDKKIPILSSNKSGIIAGSTFGPVADFYTLGQMSGRMAVRILKHNERPTRLASLVQDPPAYLANRNSMKILGIKIPDGSKANIRYVE